MVYENWSPWVGYILYVGLLIVFLYVPVKVVVWWAQFYYILHLAFYLNAPIFLWFLYCFVEYSIYIFIILSTGSVGAMICWFKAWKPEPKNIGGFLMVLDTICVNITFDIVGLNMANPCVLHFTLFLKHCIESLTMIC